MSIAPKGKRYLYDEYIKMIESEEDTNKRYEYIDGEIYMLASPSVTHQRIVSKIFGNLYKYLEGRSCEPFVAPLDVKLYDEEKNIIGNVQPDVFVVCNSFNVQQLNTPTLVIEVVSPSSRSRDYVQKLDLYMRSGIKEYWIVDQNQKKILQYTFKDQTIDNINIYTDVITSITFEGLSANLDSIF